jgi:primosomal protein N' (replication factor Y)
MVSDTTRCIARVVPDVTGLDKEFDYVVPSDLVAEIAVGSIVRVDLHGRRIGAWVRTLTVVTQGDTAADGLKPIAKITGRGPAAEIFELAEWAKVRWASRRIRPYLVTASPARAVEAPAPDRRTASAPAPVSPATRRLLDEGGGVLRLAPRVDVMPVVLAAVERGPTLVVVPERDGVALLAARLRRAGLTVAVVPADWSAAAGGVDVVIGTRTAAWAPCAGLAAAVVVDEHDEALQNERAPTWHARDVVVERCRRARVPYVLVSPAPTLTAAVEYAGAGGVVHPSAARERAGWPTVTVVDRSDDDPWKRSVVTSTLIERLRDPALTVVCVSNITGRARVLACRSCRALVRCETCDAAVGLDDDARLSCRRCATKRPPVCQACGASRFANLRPGVTRLREELEAAAARPVVAVVGSDAEPPPSAGVYVGTEAVLHRVRSADVVAFLEFDSEMLAPRFRAAEQALALLVRAGRIAPEVVIQTFVPDHELIEAAAAGDPERILDGEHSRRRLLELPPYGALALVSGVGAAEMMEPLGEAAMDVGGAGQRFVVRDRDWMALGSTLNALDRPSGSRVRVEVDPPRI